MNDTFLAVAKGYLIIIGYVSLRRESNGDTSFQTIIYPVKLIGSSPRCISRGDIERWINCRPPSKTSATYRIVDSAIADSTADDGCNDKLVRLTIGIVNDIRSRSNIATRQLKSCSGSSGCRRRG